MSMMWPPQSVKMVSTPSFFRALATKWPPEITFASRLLRCRVSSAVVALGGLEVGFTVAIVSPDSGINEPYSRFVSGSSGTGNTRCRCGEIAAALGEVADAHGPKHEQP